MQNFIKKLLLNEANASRYLTGLVLLVLVILVLILNIKFLVWALIGVFYLISINEAAKLYSLDSKPYFYIASTLIWIIAYSYDNSILIVLASLILLASYNIYVKDNTNKDFAIFIYPTIPFLCLFDIYKHFGNKALFWLIITVVIVDVMGYFGGKMFGRTKLSKASPNKTLEGALIGVVFAVLIGTLVGMLVKGFVIAFFTTLLMAIFSIFGDLYESSLKRNINVKDSGTILPGHGGILDRLDGLLFSAVIMLFILNW